MWSSWKTMQVMLWGKQGSIACSSYSRALAGIVIEIDICNIVLWTVEGEQCISLFALAHDCYVADDAGYI